MALIGRRDFAEEAGSHAAEAASRAPHYAPKPLRTGTPDSDEENEP